MPCDGVISRRDFLGRASTVGLGLGLGASLWGARGARAEPGANSRINLALVGLGPTGLAHLESLLRHPRVAVRAVCDVDSERLRVAVLNTARRPQGYSDYREMLASEQLDALVIATPDHWHAPITIEAMRAGLDVYVEKPLAWGVLEGAEVVDTARRLGRIVQVGHQLRARSAFRQVVELVRSGRLGEVQMCRIWRTVPPGPAPVPDTPPPPQLDWGRWLGPAPWAEYNPNRAHAQWRYFWDYGGGALLDWGVHFIDLVHWAMGVDSPRSIEATGSFDVTRSYETPATMDANLEYPGFHLGWSQNGFRGQADKESGLLFYGTKGRILVEQTREQTRFDVLPAELNVAPIGPGDYQLPRVRGHMEEFLDSMVSREPTSCPPEVGQAAATVCHLSNIALRLGRKLAWDGDILRFAHDSVADRLLSRAPRAPHGI